MIHLLLFFFPRLLRKSAGFPERAPEREFRFVVYFALVTTLLFDFITGPAAFEQESHRRRVSRHSVRSATCGPAALPGNYTVLLYYYLSCVLCFLGLTNGPSNVGELIGFAHTLLVIDISRHWFDSRRLGTAESQGLQSVFGRRPCLQVSVYRRRSSREATRKSTSESVVEWRHISCTLPDCLIASLRETNGKKRNDKGIH